MDCPLIFQPIPKQLLPNQVGLPNPEHSIHSRIASDRYYMVASPGRAPRPAASAGPGRPGGAIRRDLVVVSSKPRSHGVVRPKKPTSQFD